MSQTISPAPAPPAQKWYRGLDRYCWIVLLIAGLGWMFDTMDQNLFNLVRNSSITDMLRPHYTAEQLATDNGKKLLADEVKRQAGNLTALFLVGWATGGFLFGILGDRLGRTRTMIITILMYALFTGLSGFAQTMWFYATARFLTGMGVGGEFAAGAALVAETFPERSRAMALGLLQALSTVGNMVAALITMIIGNQSTTQFTLGQDWSGWRIAYLIGALPALVVLWIRTSVREPAAWTEQKDRGQSGEGKKLGNFIELFTSKELFRRTLAGSLIATAGVGALWGVGNFSVDLVKVILAPPDPRFTSYMFLLQQIGGFIGIYVFAIAAERFGRRATFIASFCFAFIAIELFFWTVQSVGSANPARGQVFALCLAPVLGFGTLGPFGGFSIYFPEMFPTRLRATGAGFCYNSARYVAAAAPFILGSLSVTYGYALSATIVAAILLCGIAGALIGPETRGQPLPEHL